MLFDRILAVGEDDQLWLPTRDRNPQALEPFEKTVGIPVDKGVNNFWG
jgi:hypothetical protein